MPRRVVYEVEDREGMLLETYPTLQEARDHFTEDHEGLRYTGDVDGPDGVTVFDQGGVEVGRIFSHRPSSEEMKKYRSRWGESDKGHQKKKGR